MKIVELIRKMKKGSSEVDLEYRRKVFLNKAWAMKREKLQRQYKSLDTRPRRKMLKMAKRLHFKQSLLELGILGRLAVGIATVVSALADTVTGHH
jgi:hypothetical protein